MGALWALYSDARRSEKTVGFYPNGLSYISFQASLFITTECGEGFEIKGNLDFKKLQHPCPGRLAAPQVAFCLSREYSGSDAILGCSQSS